MRRIIKSQKIDIKKLTFYEGTDYPNNLNLKNGDPIFFLRQGIIGWLISIFTGSPISHVGMFFKEFGVKRISESVGNTLDHGVRHKNFDEVIENRKWTFLRLRGPLIGEEDFLKDLDELDKIGYDFENFIRIAYNKNLEENTSEMFCSEYLGYLYEKYHTLDRVNTQTIVPGDFLRDKKLLDLFDVRGLLVDTISVSKT